MSNTAVLPVQPIRLQPRDQPSCRAADSMAESKSLKAVLQHFRALSREKCCRMATPGGMQACIILYVQLLRSDAAMLWTDVNSAADTISSSSCRSTLVMPPQGGRQTCQAKRIAPETTRLELCTALRPLLGARLVAAPRRKHSLLPSL